MFSPTPHNIIEQVAQKAGRTPLPCGSQKGCSYNLSRGPATIYVQFCCIDTGREPVRAALADRAFEPPQILG